MATTKSSSAPEAAAMDEAPPSFEQAVERLAEIVQKMPTDEVVDLLDELPSMTVQQLFTLLPGLGHRLAERIHDELHVDTLEALEVAAHDGRLENVPGVGPRRAAAIRASLQTMLSRGRARRSGTVADPGGSHPAGVRAAPEPPVADLLAVDRLYREKAARGELPTIAPKRFNPSGEAWLPVLHLTRHGWHYTALYSNTALAHQLDRTRDWVVLFFYDDDHVEGQHTIVTETHGPLAGRRVVRGREADCVAYHSE